jgi:endoglucanase
MWARPENMTWERPSFKVTARQPGTDVVANAAAALAAVSLAFQDTDYPYSKLALNNARILYTFAATHLGHSFDAVPQLSEVRHNQNTFFIAEIVMHMPKLIGYVQVYPASGYQADLLFAAVWMHRATEETKYLSDAHGHFQQLDSRKAAGASVTGWADQYWPAIFLLWQLTGEVNERIKGQ